jgi:hypothetical protein
VMTAWFAIVLLLRCFKPLQEPFKLWRLHL